MIKYSLNLTVTQILNVEKRLEDSLRLSSRNFIGHGIEFSLKIHKLPEDITFGSGKGVPLLVGK